LTLAVVLPNIAKYAREQDGSRFLQNVMEGSSEEDRDAVHKAALPEAVNMASDAFGNFVVQKLFERGSAEQRKAVASEMRGEIVKLANDKFGCRVIQKAFERVPVELQVSLAWELQPKVLQCIENMNGNHVIQRAIEKMPPSELNFIIDAIVGKVESTAAHAYGCRVIQRLLERCTSQQLLPMLERIPECTPTLAQDPHGNYVVQSVLEHGRVEDQRRIMAVIRADVVKFATNRCSSNVVEKCFKIAAERERIESLNDERKALLRAVLGEAGDQDGPLQRLVHDRFGNYTVQCVIKHTVGEDRELLRQRFSAIEELLHRSATGRHILTTLRKEFGRPDAIES